MTLSILRKARRLASNLTRKPSLIPSQLCICGSTKDEGSEPPYRRVDGHRKHPSMEEGKKAGIRLSADNLLHARLSDAPDVEATSACATSEKKSLPLSTARTSTEDSTACVSDAQLEPKDNAWTSAYRDAWSKRTEEEQRVLRGETLDSLFEQFNQETDQSYNDSKLHQSMEKILPLLGKMDHFLGAISPVAGTINASASNAFGVVQTLSTFVIAIAQAVPRVKEQMEKLIFGIQIVDSYARSCDTAGGALTEDGCLHEVQDVRCSIFPILCKLYSHLLDFYFLAVHLLEKGSVHNTAAVLWDEKLTLLANSFAETGQRLDALVQQENLLSSRFLTNEALSINVRTLLDGQREHEGQNLSLLEHRTDEACHWITESQAFQHWLTGGGPGSLALLGKIGFGKTFTIAYVVRYLKSGDSASQPRRNVYCYYCKDDGTANKALNVFRSLLSQLLKDHNHLSWHFNTWVREQEKDGGCPTSNISRLKDLLIDLVAMLPQPTFFIIDALDECLPDERRDLLDFLEQVCVRTTSTRVLTSARASHLGGSEKLFPKTAEPICSWNLRDLPQRDRYIAEFLVKHHMNQVSEDEDVRRILVERLTSGMQGCAIWARMNLEYLVTKRRHTSVDSIQSYLDENELPKPLAELYLGVFENVTGGDDECKWLLARSLELIAGAQYHLTFDELVYALSLYTPPSTHRVVSRAKDLAELRHILGSQVKERIRQLLRPFADLKPTVGFVHQSLKEAVLYEFPALTHAAPSRQQLWSGASGIEGVMLRTCVDYLLLPDFGRTETIPDAEWANRRLQVDKRHSASSGNSVTEPPVSSNTDPFGAFFNYAARCWLTHLGGAPVGFNLDDVLELASPTSARYRAWTLESSRQRPDPPLHFLVVFGNLSMLEQLLDRLAQNGDIDISCIVNVATVAIDYKNLGHLRALMNHRSTAMAMQTLEMLETFIHGFNWFRDKEELTEGTRLITDLFDTLPSVTIHSPNDLLQRACRAGCKPVIGKIFERAKADPAFQEKLMQHTNRMGPLGEVVRIGNVATLRYLSQQDGIEAHASNQFLGGDNILALCSRGFNTKVETIELLLCKFPWLVSEREDVHAALLGIITLPPVLHMSENAKVVKLVLQHVLQHAQATPGLVHVDELLGEAVRAGWPEMCRVLILDAYADARSVVKVSSSGRLELKKDCLNISREEEFRNADETLEAIAACLSEEVLQAMIATLETGNE